MHTHVHGIAVYNGQNLETSQVAKADDWLKRLWLIYTMECYKVCMKQWYTFLAYNIDGSRENHVEQNKIEEGVMAS